VLLTSRAEKHLSRLPTGVCDSFILLAKEIEEGVPIRGNWRNFSRLDRAGKIVYHCHIKSGRPTYVACWKVDKKLKQVEIYYVGTHEKAPY
jgi:hypothetical protein